MISTLSTRHAGHLLEEAKRVSPLAYKFQYVIEKPTEYDHHPDFFRQNDFKPGYDTFNNKERAEEMLYFMREDARLLEKLVKRYRTKVCFPTVTTAATTF